MIARLLFQPATVSRVIFHSAIDTLLGDAS